MLLFLSPLLGHGAEEKTSPLDGTFLFRTRLSSVGYIHSFWNEVHSVSCIARDTSAITVILKDVFFGQFSTTAKYWRRIYF